MRKCRQCRGPIPSSKDCTDPYTRGGFCDIACYGLNKAKKDRESRDKRQRKEHAARKESIKTLQQHVSDAQRWVNRVVVAEDRGKGCISCTSLNITDAGHFFHKGTKYRTAWLTLDRRNLNGQCKECNLFKGGGNQYEYRIGYIARYGLAAFEDLEEFKRSTDRGEIPSITIDECKQAIADSKARLKAIKTNL